MATVSAITERLGYLLLDEGAPARCAGDLRDEVLQLQSELGRIEKLLWEADAKKYVSEDLMKEVTQLAYDIEDAVESYARQEAAHEGKSGVFRYLSKSSSISPRRLREEVHIFRGKIDKIKHIMEAKKDAAAAGGRGGRGGSSSSISASPDAASQRHGQLVLAETGHIHGELNSRVKDQLLGHPPKLSVIAICGMGGLGKTTLAKSLYSDPLVVEHFHIRAWATVGMELLQATEILKDILSFTQATRIAELETMQLMEQVYKTLKGRRYLVVLDDVWSLETWESLRRVFPDDNNGSRIVITTRLMNLPTYSFTYRHRMHPLNEDESWKLFKMKLSGLKSRESEIASEMEEIGKEIVKQCRGLPLAIAAISGILKIMNFEDWVKVLKQLQQGDQNLELGEDSLAQSYHSLPFHLKPCFLYLGHFPPNQAIPVEKLYLLWIAEGLITTRGRQDKRRMEVAEDYLKELVFRSMVIVEDMEPVLSSVRINSCHLHDLMRDVCVRKWKSDGFFEVIDFDNVNKRISSTQRLAVYLHKLKETNDLLEIPAVAKHIIRSILFYDTDNKSLSSSTWPEELSDLKEFQLTRVLDFDKVDFRIKYLPRGIDKLTLLRYLSFGGCYLPEFPASLSNFPFLETLDLRVIVSCVMIISNVLKKLSNLRHLYFPLAYRSDTTDKLKLDCLKKLRILENFHAGICDADDILQLENLEIFSGIVDRNDKDLKKTINSMKGIKSLSHSSLVVKRFDSYSDERRKIVADLLECNAIHSLDIEGYIGVFPQSQWGIDSNFTEMVFNGSEFTTDPMPILGNLHHLRSLVLCNDAYIGKKMKCSEGGFLQLRSLKLATLQFLENLEVETGAMPRLTIFTIEQCNKLETLPHELTTLQKLMVGSMPEKFQNEVKMFINKMREFGNEEPTVTFYDC